MAGRPGVPPPGPAARRAAPGAAKLSHSACGRPPAVDDPHPLGVEAGRPARMRSGGVRLQLPRERGAMLAADDRAGPLQPRLPVIRPHQQLIGLAQAARGSAVGAHQDRERALDLEERPGRGPAEGAMRPSRDPRLDAHHRPLRSRALPRGRRAGSWRLLWPRTARLLRGCCAKCLLGTSVRVCCRRWCPLDGRCGSASRSLLWGVAEGLP
jgi:hypothetical protein